MPDDGTPNGDGSVDDQTASMQPDAVPQTARLQPGERVGNYVICQQIGEGGFAVVYAAELIGPVRHRVALKIIKPGMDPRQVIARFEAERQTLAMLDHPNVAKVFDAGSTGTGRPYFVMECVTGVSITEYCDLRRLSIEERLTLFTQVCDAVQHAHQKGTIHRDLKPSNVLVTVNESGPRVKVIDFGVANALARTLTEQTIYTEQGQLIDTTEYMSPEQAQMTAQDIDSRSDIYSLGVLLYELLTGILPFDPTTLRRADFAEIQRILREQEPPKPSTRLSRLGEASAAPAQSRCADPKSLLRKLRGDLDCIVMKAMQKDRNRRYNAASELSRDVQRHIWGDTIEAAPPGVAYRMVRFFRANAFVLNLVCTAGLLWPLVVMFAFGLTLRGEVPRYATISLIVSIGVVLPAFSIVVILLVYLSTRSRYSMANLALSLLFLGVYIWFEVAVPRAMATVDAVNDVGVASLEEKQGNLQEAERLLLRAQDELRRSLGENHFAVVSMQVDLGSLYRKQGRYHEAEAEFLRYLSHEHDERLSRAATRELAYLYFLWGKPTLAAEWRSKLPVQY